MGAYFFALILGLAIFFPEWLGRNAAAYDSRKIELDGTRNSLKYRFHRHNLLRRGLWIFLAVGVVISSLFLWNRYIKTENLIWFGISYFQFAAWWFGFTFTQQLNTLRGLNPWYISLEKDAAWTDRMIVKWSGQMDKTPQQFAKENYTLFAYCSAAELAINIALLL